MKSNRNKASNYCCVATSFFVSTTLHAAGIPPISITLSSGAGSNIVNITPGQLKVIEYQIQDVIGRPPSRTWLWSSPITSYITRTNSLHQPDCSSYNQPNSNPNSFLLPPSGSCYFAIQVDGTQFANVSQGTTVIYRPVFSNSGAIEYGPCLSEQISITPATQPLIAAGSYRDATTQRPLLAVSQDTGNSWNYPEFINSPQYPNPNFMNLGVFNGASCSSNICIAAGTGEDTDGRRRPILAQSTNLGSSWSYPASINATVFTAPNSNPFLRNGELYNASCIENLCIAVGTYSDTTIPSIQRPLLALTQDAGNTWIYPDSITAPLFTPDNTNPYIDFGKFYGASCSSSICVAVGSYNFFVDIERPLLAQSQDGGDTWTYPNDLGTNSITSPVFTPSDTYPFSSGSFNAANCTGNTCVAVGTYNDTSIPSIQRPLLAVSQDAGNTWTYSESITAVTILSPYLFGDLGLFNGVSCTGNTCVAVGLYNDASIPSIQRPLLAVSQNAGNTWTYSESITEVVFTPTTPNAPTFGNGYFASVSCTGTFCIAVGSYFDNISNVERPLLAQSRDLGLTWEYPGSITQPVLPNPFTDGGRFNSAQCTPSICIATGSYTDNSALQRPLLASSRDKGVTWTYSQSITEPIFTPNNTNPYASDGYFNAAAGYNPSFVPDSLQFLYSKVVTKHRK